MLQRDLEKARENLRQELVIAGSQKTHLENRLQEEVCCLHCLYCLSLRYQRSYQKLSMEGQTIQWSKEQTMIYKTLHRKLEIEQHIPH